jgi:hypothetical protein
VDLDGLSLNDLDQRERRVRHCLQIIDVAEEAQPLFFVFDELASQADFGQKRSQDRAKWRRASACGHRRIFGVAPAAR